MTLNYSWSVPHLTSPKNGYMVAHQSTYHFPQTLQNYTKVFPVSRGSRSGRSGSTATAATQERPQRPQRCRTSMDGRSAEPSGNKGLWGSVDIYIILYLCIVVLYIYKYAPLYLDICRHRKRMVKLSIGVYGYLWRSKPGNDQFKGQKWVLKQVKRCKKEKSSTSTQVGLIQLTSASDPQ